MRKMISSILLERKVWAKEFDESYHVDQARVPRPKGGVKMIYRLKGCISAANVW